MTRKAVQATDEDVLIKAFLNAGKRLGFNNEDMSEVVKCSPSNFGNAFKLSSDSSVVALDFIRIYQSLYMLFNGNYTHMQLWITGFNEGTSGIPKAQIRNGQITPVMRYLDAMLQKFEE